MMMYRDVLSLDITADDLGHARRTTATHNILPEVYDRIARSPDPDGPWGDINARYSDVVGYRTGSGNEMLLLVKVYLLDRRDVPLLTEYEHVSFCGECRGSNGGCPGFAPRFEWLRPECEEFIVVTISIDMIWPIMYATPRDGWIGRRVLKQLVYADRLTECYGRRMSQAIQNNGYVLGMGNCSGCRPSRCTTIRGKKCRLPKKRTFSMEAVGVDCDELHKVFYGEHLPWYYRGTSKIPSYMTRYIGIFPKHVQDAVYCVRDFCGSDKSYIPAVEVREPREATVSLQEIPHGVYAGHFQYVYNDPGLVKQEQV